MPQVGFVLISHSNPGQLQRLIHCLNALYSHPPIVLHHDFEQCPAELRLPSNAVVVRPSMRTGWGEFSVVRAILACMKTLYADLDSPEWCALLSGSCYPVMTAEGVTEELASGGYDAYIHHERIDPLNPVRRFPQECVRRYFAWRLRVPRRRAGKWQVAWQSVPTPRLNAVASPYARHGLECYAGALWFTCNRRAAKYLLDWSEANPWLGACLQNRALAEESYFHTVLGNRADFRLCGDHRRYIDWSNGGSHPRVLGPEDLQAMISSGAHFARKFHPDGTVLDRLDEHLHVAAAR
jgi:hypothetical protein